MTFRKKTAHELGLDCTWEYKRIHDTIALLEPGTDRTEFLMSHLERNFNVTAKIVGMFLYLDSQSGQEKDL